MIFKGLSPTNIPSSGGTTGRCGTSIIKDTQERVNSGEVEWRGGVPGGVKDGGVEEVRGSDEEK